MIRRRHKPEQCYVTTHPPTDDGLCRGWTEQGWKFCGCVLTDGHTVKGPWNDRAHRCKCGHRWKSHGRSRYDLD